MWFCCWPPEMPWAYQAGSLIKCNREYVLRRKLLLNFVVVRFPFFPSSRVIQSLNYTAISLALTCSFTFLDGIKCQSLQKLLWNASWILLTTVNFFFMFWRFVIHQSYFIWKLRTCWIKKIKCGVIWKCMKSDILWRYWQCLPLT